MWAKWIGRGAVGVFRLVVEGDAYNNQECGEGLYLVGGAEKGKYLLCCDSDDGEASEGIRVLFWPNDQRGEEEGSTCCKVRFLSFGQGVAGLVPCVLLVPCTEFCTPGVPPLLSAVALAKWWGGCRRVQGATFEGKPVAVLLGMSYTACGR